MDIEDLRTFVEVADTGGVSPAAIYVVRPPSPHPARKVGVLTEMLIASFGQAAPFEERRQAQASVARMSAAICGVSVCDVPHVAPLMRATGD